MNEEQKQRIKKKYKLIVDSLDFESVRDYMISHIPSFTLNHVDEIEAEKTRVRKNRRFLPILIELNDNRTYEIFCEALTDSVDFSYLVQELESVDITEPIEELIDTSESKKDYLQELVAKQNEMLEKILMSNADLKEQLIKKQIISEFEQATPSGKVLVKEIENFSTYLVDETDSHRSLEATNLNVKLKVAIPNREIACALGIDCISGSDFGLPFKNNFNRYKNYVLAMRNIIKEMPATETINLDNCLNNISVYEMVGYQTVKTIGDELFETCNFGRIVIWYAFWRRFAENLKGTKEEKMTFGKYVGFCLYSIPECQKWLATNNGWERLLQLSKLSKSRKSSYFGVFASWILGGLNEFE